MVQKFLFSSFLILSFSVYAQTVLSLSEAIQKTKENNKALKNSLLEVQSASKDLDKTREVLLPQVNVSLTGYNTNDPLNSFGFKLQQRTVQAVDFDPNKLNHPESNYNFNTKLSVKQPLLNFDAFEMRKALKAKVEAKALQGTRMEESFELEVRKSYLDLSYLYEADKVLNAALETYNEGEKVAKNMFDQGLIQKTDYMNVQNEKHKTLNRKKLIQNNIQNLSDYLSYLMGEKYGVVYSVNEVLSPTIFNISKNELTQRTDFKAMQKGIEVRKLMLQSEKMKVIPKINAFGEYNYNDKSLVGFGVNSYMVGVQFSWDIFKGLTTYTETAKQKIELRKAESEMENELSKSHLEILKTLREIIWKKEEIILAENRVSQYKEAVKISQNRLAQGLEKKSHLLENETKLLEKKLEHLETIKEFNKLILQYDFISIQK